MQEAEAGLGDEGTSVVPPPGNRFRHPRRIAREQIVILGRAKEADDAQLDDEIVDDFLCLFLGQRSIRKVALEVDVEEGRDTAQRHGRAILFLHSGEVAEVEPLHGFLGGARGPGDVEAVLRGHLLQLAERAGLLAELFTVPDDLVRRPLAVERSLLGLLDLDQTVDAVERDPPVIADDPAATVSVRQAGQDV